jgi:hypothetical protein
MLGRDELSQNQHHDMIANGVYALGGKVIDVGQVTPNELHDSIVQYNICRYTVKQCS